VREEQEEGGGRRTKRTHAPADGGR
jgi:hypothetical protein